MLSNTRNESEVHSLAKVLRLLVVKEWQGENAEYYQGFVPTDIGRQYLNSGEFGGDQRDLIVVTLLHIPITICVWFITLCHPRQNLFFERNLFTRVYTGARIILKTIG